MNYNRENNTGCADFLSQSTLDSRTTPFGMKGNSPYRAGFITSMMEFTRVFVVSYAQNIKLHE